MNNGDNDNRIRKYTFDDTFMNSENNQSNSNHIWPIIIFIVVVAALILGGVKAVTYFTSNHDNQTTKMTQSSNQSSSSTDESNTSEQSKNNQNKSNPSNQSKKKTMFDGTHIFSSVADAQNYAKATQSQWIQAGYQTYTVSADSQGYYILKFVRQEEYS